MPLLAVVPEGGGALVPGVSGVTRGVCTCLWPLLIGSSVTVPGVVRTPGLLIDGTGMPITAAGMLVSGLCRGSTGGG